MIKDKFALRVANVNQRSKREDFKLLIEAVVDYGNTIAAEWI